MNIESLIGPLSPEEQVNTPRELYTSGDLQLLQSGIRVAVIGSRKATVRGHYNARQYARLLVELGVTVVSGLAKGIDTVAHTEALNARGRTIAVLGTPLSRCYPAENRDLQAWIARNHLVVSQYPPGTKTNRGHFPQRTKLMALISHATVIVEAGERSGTRHQTTECLRLSRPLLLTRSLARSGIEWTEDAVKAGAIVFGGAEALAESIQELIER